MKNLEEQLRSYAAHADETLPWVDPSQAMLGSGTLEPSERMARPWVAFAAAAVLVILVGLASLISGAPDVVSPTDATTPTTRAVTTTIGSVGAAPADTPVDGESWLVYQDEQIGEKVFLIRPDGTGRHSPTADGTGYSQGKPDWSSDGKRLAFVVNDQRGTVDLWTVNADGTGATLILDCVDPCIWVDDPAWSPDGTSIAYSRMTDTGGVGRGTLEVLNLDTGLMTVILDAEATDFFAGTRWSPDGNSLAIEVVHRSGELVDDQIVGVTLSVVDLEQTPAQVLPITDPILFAVTPAWSPDGTTIVYSALAFAGAETSDLYTIRPDGTGGSRLTTLSDSDGGAGFPSFSPDGSQIIFTALLEPEGDWVMATMPADGGDPTPATSDRYRSGTHARWRPIP